MSSPAERLIQHYAAVPRGPAKLEALLDAMSDLELAALLYDWEGFWGRPEQLIDPSGRWRSHGFLTGRGYGKTFAISSWFQREVFEGRAMRIGLCAQKKDKTIEVMVEGKSGLIATSPPWFKADYVKEHVVWPNGAQARVFTPEVPEDFRGPEHDHLWLSELVAWPPPTRDLTFSLARFGLRIGAARMLWDTTPVRRHPLVRYLLARHDKDPNAHRVVRGSTRDNIANLTRDEIEALYAEYGGTRRGLEELDGIFFDEAEGALWAQDWIDRSRRKMPPRLKRRVISLDPAISTNRGTDTTGIADMGLGLDDQLLVIGDYSGRHPWEAWGAWAVRHYFDVEADCIVVETDRGGDGIAANLRACAREIGVAVEVVKLEAPTRHNRSVIYVKEVRSRRRSKGERAAPVATLAEKGRISHVTDSNLEWGKILEAPPERHSPSDLSQLEDTMTTWEPDDKGGRSPDELDAVVYAAWELARLWDKMRDHGAGFKGIEQASEQLQSQSSKRGGRDVGALLGSSEWGRHKL